MIICTSVAFPLAVSMVVVGALSIERCSQEAQGLLGQQKSNVSDEIQDGLGNTTTFDNIGNSYY